MLNVREGTFETNSSSCHNIVVVEDSQLEKWKNGELFFIENGNKFITKYEKETLLKGIYGNLVLDYANNPSYQEEIAEAIKEGTLKDYVKDMIADEIWYVDEDSLPLSFSEWKEKWYARDLEKDEDTYTTPKGEKIHIYSQYGYDG